MNEYDWKVIPWDRRPGKCFVSIRKLSEMLFRACANHFMIGICPMHESKMFFGKHQLAFIIFWTNKMPERDSARVLIVDEKDLDFHCLSRWKLRQNFMHLHCSVKPLMKTIFCFGTEPRVYKQKLSKQTKDAARERTVFNQWEAVLCVWKTYCFEVFHSKYCFSRARCCYCGWAIVFQRHPQGNIFHPSRFPSLEQFFYLFCGFLLLRYLKSFLVYLPIKFVFNKLKIDKNLSI